MPFTSDQPKRPGPGRPKGKPNAITLEVREAAREIVDDPVYRDALRERLIEGKAPHMEPLMWYYAYGKPKERVAVSGSVDVMKVICEVVDTDGNDLQHEVTH